MNREIELKFGIRDIPNLDEYENIKIYKIVQDYLYQDEFSTIRKRKILDLQNEKSEYIYTVKTKGDIKNNNSVYEIETAISKEKYESIQGINNGVEKYRIKLPIDNELIAEIDVYCENLEGLITVEVEFSDESNLEEFVKPTWFGEELDKRIFSNANLSKMSKDEFMRVMGTNNISRNIAIKSKIDKFLFKE